MGLNIASVGFLAIAIFGLARVSALPNGAPKAACPELKPLKHMVEATNINDPTKSLWTLASACYVFSPKESMRMRLWSLRGPKTYLGVISQVRKVGVKRAVGKMAPFGSSRLKAMRCNAPKDTITHTSNKPKPDSGDTWVWTAPSSCEPNEEYEIRATVMNDFDNWQENIRVALVCNPDYSNKAVMDRVRPPLAALFCSTQQSWAYIPDGYTTSFETDMGGWRNAYVDTQNQWRRTNMPTATAGTGPDKAHNDDGKGKPEWYLYYEASGADPRDSAALISPHGVEGCFCLSFWCHMKTDGKIKFTVSGVGEKSTTAVTTTEITGFWRQVKISFLTDHRIMIVIQVFRGDTQMADIGLDDIVIAPGQCKSASTNVVMTS